MSKKIFVAGLVASTSLLGPAARAQDAAPAPTEQPPAPPAPTPPAPPADQPLAPPPPVPAPAPAPVPAPPSTPAGGFAPPSASVPPTMPAVDPGAQAPAPPAPPPPAGEKKDGDKEKDKDEVKDGVRVRGGFSVNGGVMFLPNDAPSAGPSFGFAGRIGVQINHYLGIVYQNTPIVTFTAQRAGSGLTSSGGFKAGFADYNSFLFMVTLGHFFDIGAGPSVDFLAVANGHASLVGGQGVESSSGISPGAHARVAFNIGGLSGNGPRRSGFAIGVDAHPLFTGAGKGLSLTAGLGAEWY